jgi:hypothetical protein
MEYMHLQSMQCHVSNSSPIFAQFIFLKILSVPEDKQALYLSILVKKYYRENKEKAGTDL